MRRLLACAAAVLLLSGCALADDLQMTLFNNTKVNLTENTYAAADMLAPQTKGVIGQNTPIRVAPLTDTAVPGVNTPFGIQVANELASRFVQLGYNVESAAVSSGMGFDSAKSAKKGDCLMGGTYTRTGSGILVSLRITRLSDHRIIAAYDYTLPMTRQLNELSAQRPEAPAKPDAQPVAQSVVQPAITTGHMVQSYSAPAASTSAASRATNAPASLVAAPVPDVEMVSPSSH